MKPGITDRLQPDVIAALPDLQNHRVRRRDRQNHGRVQRRGGDDSPAVAEQGQLGGLAQIEQFIQPSPGLVAIALGDPLGNPAGLPEDFAHP